MAAKGKRSRSETTLNLSFKMIYVYHFVPPLGRGYTRPREMTKKGDVKKVVMCYLSKKKKKERNEKREEERNVYSINNKEGKKSSREISPK